MQRSRLLRRAAAALTLGAAMTLAACDSPEERVQNHYARGMELLAQDDPTKATLEFRNALKLDENHAPSRFEIAQLYERDGELQAALGNYRLVTELDRTQVPARLKMAQFLLLGNQTQEAARYADEALALQPDDPDVKAVVASVRFREDRRDEAIALAEQALASTPGHVGASLVLASIAALDGRQDEALARTEAALATHPEDRPLNLLKLRLLEQRDDKGPFAAHLRRMVELFPEERSLRQALARWLIDQGEVDAAEVELRALAAAAPEDEGAQLDVVRFLRQERGADAARAELEKRVAGDDVDAAITFHLALADLQREGGDDAAADATLRRVVEQASATNAAQARVALARVALGRGERDAAATLVDEALAGDQSNVDALSLRAALRIEDGRLAEALDDLRAASDLDPRNPRLMLLTAEAHQRNGDVDLAGERLAAAARTSDFEPEIALRYMNFLRGRAQEEAAATVLDEAMSRNPDSPLLLAAMTERLLREQRWDDALALAQRLAEVSNDPTVVSRVEATSLAAQGRADETIDILQDLLADERARPAALTRLVATYLTTGQIDAAQAVIDQAIADDPADPLPRILAAEVLVSRNDLDGAEAALQTIVAEFPDSAPGHLVLMRLRLSRGDIETAKAGALTALDALGDNGGGVRLLLAQTLETQGDVAGAVAQYEILHAADSGSLVVANNLASLLSEHYADDPARLEQASRLAERLRGSTVPQFQDTYGWIQFLRGEHEIALRSLLAAAEALPDNPWIRYHAGAAFHRLGRFADARGHLEAALAAADPGFTRVADVEALIATLPPAEASQ